MKLWAPNFYVVNLVYIESNKLIIQNYKLHYNGQCKRTAVAGCGYPFFG